MADRREQGAPGAGRPPATPNEVSRRAVVAGAVATTAIAAVMPLGHAAHATGADEDMIAFLLLSEALTGVDRSVLAPEFSAAPAGQDILGSDPGVDPINVKNEYFAWISVHDVTSSFGKLLQLAKDNRQTLSAIVPKVNGTPDNDMKLLARSIVLLWYLGAWYDPNDLKNKPEPSPTVVSAKAYTQGLVWFIAGAHPMGYSNLQFGYWSRDPRNLSNPSDPNNPKFVTPAKS